MTPLPRSSWWVGLVPALLVPVSCDGFMPSDEAAEVGANEELSGRALDRRTHETFFPIDTGVHGAADCNACHGGLPSFKMFSCVGCHEHQQTTAEAQHAGMMGYQYLSTACRDCHPKGHADGISRPDHSARFFPIDVGTDHGQTQCADCHKSPADKKSFTCLDCHEHAQPETDAYHQNLANYRYDSPACLSCHRSGKAVFEHAALGPTPNCIGCHQDDLAKATTTLASDHLANAFPTTCESCHTSFDAWGPGTAMRHEMVGGTTAACQSCHLANFTAAMNPYDHLAQKFPANRCNSCHTVFDTWSRFVHEPANCYDGATRRTHEKATCAQCHTVPEDFGLTSCTACHRNRGANCDD